MTFDYSTLKMASELKNWIFAKNNNIFDYTNGKWNDTSDGKSQIIEYKISENEMLNVTVNISAQKYLNERITDNDCKWRNDIKFRKEILEKIITLCKERVSVLELLDAITLECNVKISGKRVKNMIKYLENITNDGTFYFNSNDANETGPVNVTIDKVQHLIPKLITNVFANLANGKSMKVIAAPECALNLAYFIDIFDKCGLSSNVLNFYIEMPKDVNDESFPMVIINESGDVNSAVEQMILAYVNNGLRGLSVFVQQSIHGKVNERIKSQLPNLLKIGNKFNVSTDLENNIIINYDAIDIERSNVTSGISIYQFRSIDETLNLVNHFIKIPFVSIWGDLSLAIEVSKRVNAFDIYINAFPEFIYDNLYYTSCNRMEIANRICDSIDFSSDKILRQNIDLAINAQIKWNRLSDNERLRLINNFILKNIELKCPLEKRGPMIDEIKYNCGEKIIISYSKPMGIIIFEASDEINENDWRIILNNLYVGNAIILIKSRGNKSDVTKVHNYITLIEKSGIEKSMIQVINNPNFDGKSSEINVMIDGQRIGLYFPNISNLSSNTIISRIKYVNMNIGEINFAN